MEREVYITTFFGAGNYGSTLQAFALSKVIQNEGYEVFFLERFRAKRFIIKHPIMLYSRVVNKINQKRDRAFFNPVPYSISEKRAQRLETIKTKYFKIRSFSTDNEWEKAVDRRAIFVAGSDILWNPARGYPSLTFLDFAYFADLPRFSYGSSIGALELPEKYYAAYRRYLGSMIEVGVREQSVADMLEHIIQRKVTKVADPSLLLTSQEWDQFADLAELSIPISNKGFILCYFVMNDPRYWAYVQKIKMATDMQIIVLPMHELDEEQPYDVILDGTPYEFIWLIKNAEFICTDSFHACAISTIYQKEFYLLRRARKAEDAKYDDFLFRYNLADCRITDENSFIRKQQIDYTLAQRQLDEDRAFSMDFLRDALSRC